MSLSPMHDHPLRAFGYCPKCGSPAFRPSNAKASHCGACGFTYYFNPSAAVAVFITDGRKRLLVAVRGKEPALGSYDLPGGFVDPYETGEEAAAREIREECGIDLSDNQMGGIVAPLRYLFSLPNIYPYSGFDVHTLDLFFRLELADLDPYVGRGQDDVQELIALPYDQIDPSTFGLASIARAVECFLLRRDLR